MRKRRGRTRMVRRRRSVNRPGGTPETTWEAGWLSCSGLGLPDQPAPSSHDPSRWPVCEVHDPTGEPGAGNPHAGFGERGTGNAAMGAGLRPGAKATDKPPDPNAGAPAPDSTISRNDPGWTARHLFKKRVRRAGRSSPCCGRFPVAADEWHKVPLFDFVLEIGQRQLHGFGKLHCHQCANRIRWKVHPYSCAEVQCMSWRQSSLGFAGRMPRRDSVPSSKASGKSAGTSVPSINALSQRKRAAIRPRLS